MYWQMPDCNIPTAWMELAWNCCLLMMPKLSVGVCPCSIWASSTSNPALSQSPPLSTMPTPNAQHHHQ